MTALPPSTPRDTADTRAAMRLAVFLTRLIWLCVLPLVLLAVYLAVDRLRDAEAARGVEAENLVGSIAAAVDQHLKARIGALQMVALSPLPDSAARRRDLYRQAQDFRQSFSSHVILADVKLQMLFNTRAPFGAVLPILPKPQQGRAADPLALETGLPAVGDVVVGPLSGEALVAIAVPIKQEDRPAYLLLTTLEIRQFQGFLEQIKLPPGWAVSLRNSQDRLIASGNPGGQSTAAETPTRFVASSTVAPWSLVLEIPYQIQRSARLTRAAALLAAILAATFIGVLGGMLASHRLRRSMAALLAGSSVRRRGRSIAEIETMGEILDASENALKAAQQLAGIGNWTWNIASDAHVWSDEIYRIYGRNPAMPPARYPEVQQYFTPESWPQLAAAVEQCRAEGIAYQCDVEVVRADGSHRWATARGEAMRDAEGKIVRLLGTVQDITERKRAEEELRDGAAFNRAILDSVNAEIAVLDRA